MKLVIDIPNEVYDWHVNGFPDEEDAVRLLDIVKNGTPLEESDDCVSRQAALRQAINAHKMAQENGFDFKDICEEYLNVLPPVTPQPCEDAVSRECNNCAYYVNGANDEACDGCFADEYEHPNFKPKAQPCVDCVSRQAVEDAIAEYSVNGESLGYAVAYDILSDLPPVTPQPKMQEVLDKIRAEIEQVAEEESKFDKKWAQGVKYAVKIIDKYKAEKE